MEILGGTLFFLLGSVVGSFLMVVAARYESGEPFIFSRSHCPSCKRILSPLELIPLFSFLFLWGRCRRCGVPLRALYPVSEFLSGLLFLGIFWKIYPYASSVSLPVVLSTLYLIVIMSFLMLVFLYDVREKIIPDVFVYPFIALSLIPVFISFPPLSLSGEDGMRALSGPLVAAPLFLLWALSRGKWIGFGDVKLALGMGWFLGASGGVTALMLAFWSGAAVGLGMLAASRVRALRLREDAKALTMKSEIPFAPFLIFGLVIVFFFDLNLFALLDS